ncbi:hypothetical protein GSI_08321 [Ganoderma sinense ZZ0214-1]|uniref:Uncharacterized protein n=1 Tax=Ganoderma sinense ZZ0214-1 TaxID=1077348 RepID=A0A2G8S6W2_9APHY|nr:hypothetical protein GSI_08321 [Ganoderma sinense ZZ0214-1]
MPLTESGRCLQLRHILAHLVICPRVSLQMPFSASIHHPAHTRGSLVSDTITRGFRRPVWTSTSAAKSHMQQSAHHSCPQYLLASKHDSSGLSASPDGGLDI